MIDQESVVALAIKAGVIDSADINSIHIPQAYIDDLAHFAHLVEQLERANTVKMLEMLASNLLESDDQRGHDVLWLAVSMIEDAE